MIDKCRFRIDDMFLWIFKSKYPDDARYDFEVYISALSDAYLLSDDEYRFLIDVSWCALRGCYMYIPKVLCMNSDTSWSIDTEKLVQLFMHDSDIELAYECIMIGECYKAMESYSEHDFPGVPDFLYVLDAWRDCLFASVAKRYVDNVIGDISLSVD